MRYVKLFEFQVKHCWYDYYYYCYHCYYYYVSILGAVAF